MTDETEDGGDEIATIDTSDPEAIWEIWKDASAALTATFLAYAEPEKNQRLFDHIQAGTGTLGLLMLGSPVSVKLVTIDANGDWLDELVEIQEGRARTIH